MSTTTTYRAIEEALVARIAALDATPYAQGGTAQWRESQVPLSVIQDPSSLAHLAFNVWIQNAASGLSRQGELDEVYVTARLVAAFSFRLRPGNQVADARIATDAAVDLTQAVLAPSAAGPSAVVSFVDGLQPALSIDGEWLLVTQTYEVRFDLALSRSS